MNVHTQFITNTHTHTHRASRKTCSACESCLETKKDGFHLFQLDMCHGNHILTTSQLDETCTGPWPNGRGDLKTKEGLPPWHPAISSCSPSCLFNMTCILQIFLWRFYLDNTIKIIELASGAGILGAHIYTHHSWLGFTLFYIYFLDIYSNLNMNFLKTGQQVVFVLLAILKCNFQIVIIIIVK